MRSLSLPLLFFHSKDVSSKSLQHNLKKYQQKLPIFEFSRSPLQHQGYRQRQWGRPVWIVSSTNPVLYPPLLLVTPLTPTFWSLDAVLPAALQLLPLLRTAATSPCSPCPRISRTATPSGISLEFSPSIPFRSLIVPDSVGPRAASCIAARRTPSTSWPRTSWSPEQMRTRRAPLCIFPSTVQRYALFRLLKRLPLGYWWGSPHKTCQRRIRPRRTRAARYDQGGRSQHETYHPLQGRDRQGHHSCISRQFGGILFLRVCPPPFSPIPTFTSLPPLKSLISSQAPRNKTMERPSVPVPSSTTPNTTSMIFIQRPSLT